MTTENFDNWMDTFVSEKEINLYGTFEYNYKGTWHYMTVGVVVDSTKVASTEEQRIIKDTLVKIDFINGNVYNYLQHLGLCLVKVREGN